MTFFEPLTATNFSFLRGASHPHEMVARAHALGMAGIGIADRKWGETPLALLRPLPGHSLNEADVREACRTRLADYKLPRHIVIRDEPLPRGMSGKVLKRDLRNEYAGFGSTGK